MSRYDVFNGDADGICALHQLRLAQPAEAVLVTGVKRDVALLARVPAGAGDVVTVLDISVAANRDALAALLDRGADVVWFDHHYAGELPRHPRLAATIDTSASVCTSMLVDRHLGGAWRPWAIAAAFGDNLDAAAQELGAQSGLAAVKLAALRELGEALAYNAYGETEADLIIAPAELYRRVHGHADPWRFLREDPIVARISRARREDLRRALAVQPGYTLPHAAVYVLPDAAWSRRVHGAFGNRLANDDPARAHAVVAPNARGGWTVSVRAPRATPIGADALCRQFAGGGGRAAAAGINDLAHDALPDFVRRLEQAYS